LAQPRLPLKKFLPRRAKHLHNFSIENSSPRRETGRGLFQSDGGPYSRGHGMHILLIDIRDRPTAVINPVSAQNILKLWAIAKAQLRKKPLK
jgi:hypothetical protein